jgi:hypothetical protein
MMGCKKDSTPKMLEDPVFHLSFEVDGAKHKLTAGKDGGYLKTGLSRANNGVLAFSGKLYNQFQAQAPKLEILLIGTDATKTFNLQDYSQQTQRALYTKVNGRIPGDDLQIVLKPRFADAYSTATLLWRIEGNSTTFTSNQNPSFQVDLDNYPVIPVRLAAIYPDGCRHEVRHRLDFNNLHLNTNFEVDYQNSQNFTFKTSERLDISANDITWFINQMEVGRGLVHHHPATHGMHQVRMVTQIGQHSGETIREFLADSARNFHVCPIDFDFDILPNQGVDYFKYGTVLVRLTHTDGRVYSSANISQPSMIQLSDFEYFLENEYQQKTIRFSVSGDFSLEDEAGNKVQVTNLNGFFGVAVPD